MDKIDSRTLPLDALNERRRRAVKMRLDGASLKDTAAQCEMNNAVLFGSVASGIGTGEPCVHTVR